MSVGNGLGRVWVLGVIAITSFVGTIDSAWAARVVSVTGRVCAYEEGIFGPAGATLNVSPIRPPAPGEVRCSASAPGQGRLRVTAVNRNGKIVASARTTRSGRYRLKLKGGDYVFRVEGAGYDISGQVRGSALKNVDFVLGIVFLA
jgi:hypothetical protein